MRALILISYDFKKGRLGFLLIEEGGRRLVQGRASSQWLLISFAERVGREGGKSFPIFGEDILLQATQRAAFSIFVVGSLFALSLPK